MDLNLRQALESKGAKLDESQTKFVEGLEQELRSAFSNVNASVGKTIEEALAKQPMNEDVAKELRSLGEAIEAVKQNGLPNLMTEEAKKQLRSYVDKHRDEIVDALKSQRSLGSEDKGLFQIRVAAPHYNSNGTVSNAVNVVAPTVSNYDDGAIAEIRYPENFILGLIRNRQVGKVVHTRFRKEQTTTEGDAAIVAEAAEKPLIQYKFVQTALSRVKYAGRIEWSEEFEMDNDAIFNAIVRMFEDQVIRKWNTSIYSAMVANAVPYTTSTMSGTVVAPNATDVAIVLQSLINAQNYTADTVVVNPMTLAQLLLIKKPSGEYIQNPAFVNGRINGMRVVANNAVSAGSILVLDSSIYAEEHSNYIMRVGTYDDQFITNEKTMIGEIFSILDFAKIDLVASRAGTIATIIADLEVEAPAE